MPSHKIAVIGGDGIGTEVVEAGVQVLDVLAKVEPGLSFDFTRFDWGSDYYRHTGRMMAEDGLAQIEGFDAIYFGAVGDPHLPDDITLWGLRLAICQGFDQYANVRPTRLLPGLKGPLRPELGEQIDWVIVRENSEGEYAGVGGRAHQGLPIEVGMDVAVFTRVGIERIARFACDLAISRPRKLLTVVTKSNAQRHGMVLWDTVVREVIKDYPGLTVDWMLVDAMTQRMVNKPGTIDTVLATNLHADILSDLAAALGGSLGIGSTANIDPSRHRPSMFEPIHGSAFDIMGKGIANPLGSFWTASLMLDHLGEKSAARRLMSAIEVVTARGEALSPDLGGSANTQAVTDAVIGAIKGENR
jgi:tartrate dehydrogenase/decarboxylase/D-malate dehydrogenase